VDAVHKTKVFFKARVLVVDDNNVNQSVAQRMLKKLGVELVDIAADGQEAIDKLVRLPFDLVFMDCQMPVMDGYITTQCIRNPETPVLNPHIPIIAMTANAMPSDREKCFRVGMDDFIAKPIDMVKLQGLLKKWLAKVQTDKALLVEDPSTSVHSTVDVMVFDYEAISKRLMDDKVLIQEVVEVFLEDMPKQIKQLDMLVLEGDIEKITALAHKIKGASANVGGMQLSTLALDIEAAGKADNPALVRKKTTVLTECFEKLKATMEKVLL